MDVRPSIIFDSAGFRRIGEKTQLAAIRGFLPIYVVTALFVCYSKTAVCGAARRARADFFGFLCARWGRTQSAAARPRADAAMMAHSGQLFLGSKTAFLSGRLEPPNLGRCAMRRHQLPAPRRGRLPRPPWRPARGRLFYRDRPSTGRKSKNGATFSSPSHQSRAARGAMIFTSGWTLLSSVISTTSCDDTEELSAL